MPKGQSKHCLLSERTTRICDAGPGHRQACCELLAFSDSAHPWASPLRGAVSGVQNGSPAVLSGIKIKKGYPIWGSPFFIALVFGSGLS
tara:strand:- start:437 stop:703 length:267 start_codon:yes stop_codon:yes gene_type:complete